MINDEKKPDSVIPAQAGIQNPSEPTNEEMKKAFELAKSALTRSS